MIDWRFVRLSEHFRLGEFACHGTRCVCHGLACGIAPALVTVLEEARGIVSAGPVKITSGVRCDEHNRKVGGHKASFHRVGLAADITNFHLRQDLEGWALKIGQVVESWCGPEHGNVIYYPNHGFIHVDVGHRISDLVRRKDERTQTIPPDAV